MTSVFPANGTATPRPRIPAGLLNSDIVKVIAILLVFAWFPIQSAPWRSVNDADLWWHLRAGEWIVQHHQLPHTDPFSTTGAGKPWVAYSWPFEVLLFEIVHSWDLTGVAAFNIAIWMLIVIAVFHLLRGLTPSFWTALALTFVVGVILPRSIAARPGTFTVLFFVLELDILSRVQRNASARWLALVPLLIWAWACVHVQFVYGLFLLGLFCIEPILNRFFQYSNSDQVAFNHRLWFTLAISVPLTFANPYGAGPYRVLIDAFRQSHVFALINEMRPMDFQLTVHYLVLCVCLVAAAAVGRHWPVRPLWLVLFTWAVIMTFRAERDLWLAAVIGAAVIAVTRKSVPRNGVVNRQVWLASAACLLGLLVGVLKLGPTNKQLLSIIATEYPVGAVAYIHEHHLNGPLFNDYDWGGYLIYSLPEIPVVIDGRANIHGLDEIERSLQTWNAWDGWDTDPLLQRANLVVAPRRAALTRVLASDARFKVLFEDRISVLFQRTPVAASRN